MGIGLVIFRRALKRNVECDTHLYYSRHGKYATENVELEKAYTEKQKKGFTVKQHEGKFERFFLSIDYIYIILQYTMIFFKKFQKMDQSIQFSYMIILLCEGFLFDIYILNDF